MKKTGLRQEILTLPNGNVVIHIVRNVGNETVLYATAYSYEMADVIFNYLFEKVEK